MSSHANNEHDYHPPGLQHQFEDMEQQEESVSIGMWAFLVQEIMFFGGLFTVYLVFRSKFPMAFAAGSNHLDAFLGGTKHTCSDRHQFDDGADGLLRPERQPQYTGRSDRSDDVLWCCAFSVVKAIEYSDKYNHGLVPADGWNMSTGRTIDGGIPAVVEKEHEPEAKPAGEHGEAEHLYVNPTGEFQWTDVSLIEHALQLEKETNKPVSDEKRKDRLFFEWRDRSEKFGQGRVKIFFWIYFMMTGLHALHMIVGLGLMTWLLYKAWKGTFSAEYYAPVEIFGIVLAFRRYCLDLSVPAALFARKAFYTLGGKYVGCIIHMTSRIWPCRAM